MPVPELLRSAITGGLGAVAIAEPAPPEIVDPPQYSVAWVILAILCVLVITALVWGTLRITRSIEKRAAYSKRPSDVENLKAEFLRAVNRVADRHEAGQAAVLDHRDVAEAPVGHQLHHLVDGAGAAAATTIGPGTGAGRAAAREHGARGGRAQGQRSGLQRADCR